MITSHQCSGSGFKTWDSEQSRRKTPVLLAPEPLKLLFGLKAAAVRTYLVSTVISHRFRSDLGFH